MAGDGRDGRRYGRIPRDLKVDRTDLLQTVNCVIATSQAGVDNYNAVCHALHKFAMLAAAKTQLAPSRTAGKKRYGISAGGRACRGGLKPPA